MNPEDDAGGAPGSSRLAGAVSRPEEDPAPPTVVRPRPKRAGAGKKKRGESE